MPRLTEWSITQARPLVGPHWRPAPETNLCRPPCYYSCSAPIISHPRPMYCSHSAAMQIDSVNIIIPAEQQEHVPSPLECLSQMWRASSTRRHTAPCCCVRAPHRRQAADHSCCHTTTQVRQVRILSDRHIRGSLSTVERFSSWAHAHCPCPLIWTDPPVIR